MPHTFAHTDCWSNSGNESLPKQMGKRNFLSRDTGSWKDGQAGRWNHHLEPENKANSEESTSVERFESLPGSGHAHRNISVMSANKFSFSSELFWIGIMSSPTENILTNTEEQGGNTFSRLFNTSQGSLMSGKVSQKSNPIPFGETYWLYFWWAGWDHGGHFIYYSQLHLGNKFNNFECFF